MAYGLFRNTLFNSKIFQDFITYSFDFLFFFFKWKFLSRGGATATVEATLSSYVVSHMGGPLLISILFPLLSENILPMIFKSF